MMEVKPVRGRWAVFVDTIDGVKALMTFDSEEEAFLDVLDRLTEVAQRAEDSGYTLSEILKCVRHPRPEDYKNLPEGFEPIIICKISYDILEYDLIALGRVIK